ncbi:MAG TPA: hypothetical protein VKG79_01615, partial [Bryobacteraceae bacterium]|nr:hypothetical protein [Bryobacteraceae bacterium]
RTSACRLVLTLCLIPLSIYGQYPYPRTRRGTLGTAAPPGASVPKGVIIVFKGKLKVLDKKKMVIETEDSELLTIKLTGKTKFVDAGKTIKPAEIDLEMPVTVDASQDTDASLLAVNVTVDSPDKKAEEKPAAKQN